MTGSIVEIDGGGRQYVCASTLAPKSFALIVNCEMKLVNGANTDLVKAYQFDSLTGSGTSGGVQRCGCEHVVLDGNTANNPTGGTGVKYYRRFRGWRT